MEEKKGQVWFTYWNPRRGSGANRAEAGWDEDEEVEEWTYPTSHYQVVAENGQVIRRYSGKQAEQW